MYKHSDQYASFGFPGKEDNSGFINMVEGHIASERYDDSECISAVDVGAYRLAWRKAYPKLTLKQIFKQYKK